MDSSIKEFILYYAIQLYISYRDMALAKIQFEGIPSLVGFVFPSQAYQTHMVFNGSSIFDKGFWGLILKHLLIDNTSTKFSKRGP